MGEYTQMAFTLTRGVGLAPQGRAEHTLVSRERTLRLPTLPIHPPVPTTPRLLAEPPHHLLSVAALGPLPSPVPPVQRNHRRADTQVFAAVAVTFLAVEGCVREHPVVLERQRSLRHDGAELRRVVGRADTDPRRREEVAGRIAGYGQLRPQPGAMFTVSTLKEVAGGVPALHAGGIDGGGRLGVDQTALLCLRGDAVKEEDQEKVSGTVFGRWLRLARTPLRPHRAF